MNSPWTAYKYLYACPCACVFRFNLVHIIVFNFLSLLLIGFIFSVCY